MKLTPLRSTQTSAQPHLLSYHWSGDGILPDSTSATSSMSYIQFGSANYFDQKFQVTITFQDTDFYFVLTHLQD